MIQGFNTFLPPGYRIECSLDPLDPNPIRVTTPTGTTTRSSYANGDGYAQDWDAAHELRQETAAEIQHSQIQAAPQQAASGGQIEFNHAISYVNKIKTRFANQPDIYKQFLEILQTYQREQKPISDVYEQVTVLFSNSPDLLDDFKQFLPDTSSLTYPESGAQVTPQEQEFYADGQAPQLPPVGNFQPQTIGGGMTSPHNTKMYDGTSQAHLDGGDMISGDHLINGDSSKARPVLDLHEDHEEQYSNVRSGPMMKRSRANSGGNGFVGRNGEVAPTVINATLVPGIPEPVPPQGDAKTTSLSEEMLFFDRVKRAIGNKQTYNEFLKLLNLFSQDIIDKPTLVTRVDSFIGDSQPELMAWFKLFVGFEDKPQRIEDIVFKKHQLELSLCKAYGPSYRELPKAETFMPCSGRDEMCWEVLNDEWVGHPTWASEDSGFVAHRKNQYEEILFKIEEERLEFDYHIESNLRTIQILEAIANRLANMTREQKLNFKLPPGLGHNSTTIYKKVIRKIYDKDRGFEVIDALHENPAVAVPIVLKRLKQKDEEWKRAHREWNKVWREMEQKVFFKSLDHLGLTFKQADKKLLTVKQLVSDISTVKVEQLNKRLHPHTPKPQGQLNYQFDDYSIFADVLKLADVFINKCSNYSIVDREKMMNFLRSFVSLMFDVSSDKLIYGDSSSKTTQSSDAVRSENISADSHSLTRKRSGDTDLLRDVLKKQKKTRKDDSGETSKQNNNDVSDVSDDVEKLKEIWIDSNSSESSSQLASPSKRDRYNFFCNTTIYVFFRHLRTLYERLEEIKAMNESVGRDIRSRKIPQFAKDLNLVSHQLDDMGIKIVGTGDCYQQVLALSEKLLEGEIEHQWFEETVRQAYSNKAYKIYTVDKVVQSLVKHMHSIISDSRTSEMMVLFEADRSNPSSTAKDQILYRLQVRSLMTPEENMFNIMYRERNEYITVQFVGLDDLTINDYESNVEKYNYYVTSYIMSHPTEGVPSSKIAMPFMRSFIDAVDEEQCEGQFNSGLRVSVCENSFRLFFNPETQDIFTANSVYQKSVEDTQPREEKLKALRDLIENAEYGWKNPLEEDQLPETSTEAAFKLLKQGPIVEESGVTEVNLDIADVHPAAALAENDPRARSSMNGNSDSTPVQDAEVTVPNDSTINETTLGDATLPQEDVSVSS